MQRELSEKTSQIDLLHKERQEVIDKMKRRETDLYKYKFKIKDLKKAKQVLTHKTDEMNQSLKPKETQIDNLKDQLLKLEEVFQSKLKECNDLGEKLSKLQSKINHQQKDLTKQQLATKEKQAIIMKFSQDVHKIV